MSNVIGGTYADGRIVLQTPVDWPEGARVEVTLADQTPTGLGMTEAEWRTDPESIAQWLKAYDALEPLEFTPQEEADLADWRRKLKAYDVAKSQERIERLSQ